MKRIKIMLMSLALVAVVGAAFAFKAAKRSPNLICTTATVNGTCTVSPNLGRTCANVAPTQTLTFTRDDQFGTSCATTVASGVTNCSQVRCPIKATVATEEIP